MKRGELKPEDDWRRKCFCSLRRGTRRRAGTFTNTQRLLQWREKAVEPPGDARSETWFMFHLGRRLKEKAKNDARPRNAGLQRADLGLSDRRRDAEPEVEEVLQEINGWTTARPQAAGAGIQGSEERMDRRRADAGFIAECFPKTGENRANERESKDYLGHGWGFAWPNDRRIIYNRASARPDGKPWSERKKLVWWDEEKREVDGAGYAGL